ncbi:MAG: bifunctional 4-hydroxy-2-oxoglutarate aldolase/2-dehydro-3-deoxy-phosphogluconate aldolase [Chloroflexota bacterium]|nr:bifunctional 4-hydroxy-2-oxoglutarate aldolase/2-dehydro-3-deoxy-phosphogluconate aldolase [Chloroflexota bacterium]
MDIDQFKRLPILGIVRGVEADAIEPLVETVVSARLQTIEITMNTPGAPDLIRRMVDAAGDRLTVGAGTVLTMESLHAALDAGATFIVMPTLVPDIVEYCAQRQIPVFPGALTPQEIYTAWCAGATMVKVFPARLFGPAYFKEIKGPFNDVELLACGGVTAENIGTYLSNGASAVAIGESVFRKEWLTSHQFTRIGEAVESLTLGLAHMADR